MCCTMRCQRCKIFPRHSFLPIHTHTSSQCRLGFDPSVRIRKRACLRLRYACTCACLCCTRHGPETAHYNTHTYDDDMPARRQQRATATTTQRNVFYARRKPQNIPTRYAHRAPRVQFGIRSVRTIISGHVATVERGTCDGLGSGFAPTDMPLRLDHLPTEGRNAPTM